MASVQLESVSFRYPGASEETLSNLDLAVADGSTHALLGASGAGKTTLLNLLSGLLPPSGGQIMFDSRNVSELGARDRNVALVFQFPVLYETKSVLDNLMFPLLNRGWSQADARQRACDIAGELELEDVLHAKPRRLSLFQKQLTAIAKSLVRTDVDLVLLDEPLTSVEPARKWRLRQMLLRFQARHGLTMIYVTHDQTEALTFASQVSVLADGRILQTGSPEEIYNRPVNRFVGDFIGSPGMRFIAGETLRADHRLRDLQFATPIDEVPAGAVGLRAEWLQAERHADGAWDVRGVSLKGTQEGAPRSLLTLCQNGQVLMAQASGTWQAGDRARLRVSRYAFVESAEAAHAE